MSYKAIKRLSLTLVAIIIGILLVYVGLQTKFKSSASSTPEGGTYEVISVSDGDTVVVSYKGQKQTVRMIGMDTPEVVDPRKPVQCFGREASAKAHQLLDGVKINLEFDEVVGDKDKYNRMLAYVFLGDGTLYNQKMIAEGFAHEYTYNKQEYKYQAQFKSAQAEAEAKQLGFWGSNTCNGDTKKEVK